MSILPPKVFDSPIDSRGNYTPSFHRFLSDLAGAVNGGATAVDIAAIIQRIATMLGSPDGTIESIPPPGGSITGSGWIKVAGSLASGNVAISQRPSLTTDNLPEGTTNLYYTNARADARIALAGADSGVLPMVTGEIVSGQPMFVYGPDGSLVYGAV